MQNGRRAHPRGRPQSLHLQAVVQAAEVQDEGEEQTAEVQDVVAERAGYLRVSVFGVRVVDIAFVLPVLQTKLKVWF